MSIRRLNHAVLYVRNARASADFYTRVLGFRVRAAMGDQAFFLQAEGSQNDHDLGLFQVGERPAGPHTVGLYHLAWQVQTLEELAEMMGVRRERVRMIEQRLLRTLRGAHRDESDRDVS